MLLAALWRRRLFCRYACPTGLVAEWAGRMPGVPKHRIGKWPGLGLWFLGIGFGGACLGYPLFLWLDPLAMFNAFVWACLHPADATLYVTAIGLPLILVISVFLPGLWCAKCCPLGALQDVLAKLRPRRTGAPVPHGQVARRTILALGIGAGLGGFMRKACAEAKMLRPPLAVPDPWFAGLCIRCGNCIRQCPAGILKPDLSGRDVMGLLAPTVSFEKGFCEKDCRICMTVCPSGAIANRPLPEKWTAPLGHPVIDHEMCVLNETECRQCINACPYEAIRTEWNEETYQAALLVDPVKCPGCGACEQICPTTPVKAIVIKPSPVPKGSHVNDNHFDKE